MKALEIQKRAEVSELQATQGKCLSAGPKGEVNIEGVILDLDGLVLDTECGYWSAWKHAAESMGYQVPHALRKTLSGCDGEEVKRILLSSLGDSFDWAEFTRRSSKFWYTYVGERGIPVKRGVLGCLSLFEQKKIPFCLATNSYRANALECLEFSGLERHFDLVVARDDVRFGKPAPDIFLLAAARLEVEIDRCLVLEDSLSGVAGGTASGAFTVLVRSLPQDDQPARRLADGECRDLQQVSECLEVLWG